MSDMFSRMGNLLKAEVSAVFSADHDSTDETGKKNSKKRKTKIREEFSKLKDKSLKKTGSASSNLLVINEQQALKLLGLNSVASLEQIQEAYWHKVQQIYPQTFLQDLPKIALEAESELVELTKALEFLELQVV